MFGSSYWIVGPSKDGRRWAWAKSPTFTCPVERSASEARREGALPSEELMASAAILGVDARWLAMRLAGASHGRERDAQERLTDRCRCGAKLRREGFACWVERLPTEDELEQTGAQISRALGGDGWRQDGPRRYMDTKREAEAWAREQLAVARSAEETT